MSLSRKVPPSVTLPRPLVPRDGTLNQAIMDMYRVLQRRIDAEITSGLFAELPTSDGSDRVFWATDTLTLYFDTASGWVDVAGAGAWVTSVTGTAPIVSSGGATPAISLTSSAFFLTLLDDTTAGAVLTTLGVSAFVQTILNDADAATVRATIGVGTGSGTVTAVTGSAPILSSGGATPDISLDASAFFLTLLDDVDAATFRATIGAGTGSGTVTNVTATLPLASSGGATPDISLAASAFFLTLLDDLDAAAVRATIGAGTGSGTVTGVTATAPLASSGGAAPDISLTASAFFLTLLDDADAAAVRATIGAGTGSGTVTGVTASSPLASSGGAAPVISVVDVATLNTFIGTGGLTITGGDFNVVRSASGGTVGTEINNTSNTASSVTRLILRSAGALSGDAFFHARQDAVMGWSFGIDVSDAAAFVISGGDVLGTNNAIKITTSYGVSIPSGGLTVSGGNLDVTGGNIAVYKAASGGAVSTLIWNSSNTAGASAELNLQVGGTTAGDPFASFEIPGGTSWSAGVDNSASDAFVIAASAALGTSNTVSISTAGSVSIPLGNLSVTRSESGGGAFRVTIGNTSNTANSHSGVYVYVAGSSAGDPHTRYTVDGVTDWVVGVDNSDADAFVIAASGALGTSNMLKLTVADGDMTLQGGISIVSGSIDVQGGGVSSQQDVSGARFYSNSAASSIVAGTGAGTSPTINVTNSSDAGGTIVLVVGTSPASNAIIGTITFAGTFPAAPVVVLSPGSVNAANLAVSNRPYVDDASTTTTKCVIRCAGALAAGVGYRFNYIVLGR